MTVLRVTLTTYVPSPSPYRQETLHAVTPTPSSARHVSDAAQAASAGLPYIAAPIPVPPRLSEEEHPVSRVYAARSYQANVPAVTYLYAPAPRERRNDRRHGRNAADTTGAPSGTHITLVPYDPGMLVDRYA